MNLYCCCFRVILPSLASRSDIIGGGIILFVLQSSPFPVSTRRLWTHALFRSKGFLLLLSVCTVSPVTNQARYADAGNTPSRTAIWGSKSECTPTGRNHTHNAQDMLEWRCCKRRATASDPTVGSRADDGYA